MMDKSALSLPGRHLRATAMLTFMAMLVLSCRHEATMTSEESPEVGVSEHESSNASDSAGVTVEESEQTDALSLNGSKETNNPKSRILNSCQSSIGSCCNSHPSYHGCHESSSSSTPTYPRKITVSGTVINGDSGLPFLEGAFVLGNFDGVKGKNNVRPDGTYTLEIDGSSSSRANKLKVCANATRYELQCFHLTRDEGVKHRAHLKGINFSIKRRLPDGVCKISDDVFKTGLEEGGCIFLANQTVWSAANSMPMNFADARTYCEELDEYAYFDWKLPTKADLLAVSGATKAATHFKFTTNNRFFWSSLRTGSALADSVNLETGVVSTSKAKKKLSVVCIRKL